LRVEYYRFTRLGSASEIRVLVPSGDRDETVEITFPQEHFGEFELSTVVPRPREITSRAGETVFLFDPGTREEVFEARFALWARGMGPISPSVRAGAARAEFFQFVWP
jgi:hypothetical protein